MAMLDIIGTCITEIVGDFGFKNYARTLSSAGFLQGIVGYVGVIFFLIRSLRRGSVLYVNGMWDGMSGILESLAAFFILGERLKHPMQYVALAIITGGIVMLRYYGISA